MLHMKYILSFGACLLLLPALGLGQDPPGDRPDRSELRKGAFEGGGRGARTQGPREGRGVLVERVFNVLDRNHDGRIDLQEFREEAPRLMQRIMARQAGGRGPMGPGPQARRREGRGGAPGSEMTKQRAARMAQRLFRALDVDGDGVVDRREFMGRMPQIIQRVLAARQGRGAGAWGRVGRRGPGWGGGMEPRIGGPDERGFTGRWGARRVWAWGRGCMGPMAGRAGRMRPEEGWAGRMWRRFGGAGLPETRAFGGVFGRGGEPGRWGGPGPGMGPGPHPGMGLGTGVGRGRRGGMGPGAAMGRGMKGPGGVRAGQPGGPQRPAVAVFGILDANHDGRVDAGELRQAVDLLQEARTLSEREPLTPQRWGRFAAAHGIGAREGSGPEKGPAVRTEEGPGTRVGPRGEMGPGRGMGPRGEMGPGRGMGPRGEMGPGRGMGLRGEMGPGRGMGPRRGMNPNRGLAPGRGAGPESGGSPGSDRPEPPRDEQERP
jgi:Ca2+-binding EF-hand superfamily protein